MAFKSYFVKTGRLRLVSNTASGGPFFLEVPFRGTITAPADRSRPPETMVHDRGRLTELSHYVMGPDTPITDPLPFSCKFRLANTEPNFSKFLTAIRGIGSNPSPISANPQKTIGGRVWGSAKTFSTARNAEVSGGGTAVHTTPGFLDLDKWCVHVEMLWEDPDNSNDRGFRWEAVYFSPDRQVTEGETEVSIDLSGDVYGLITAITAFQGATES